jgi:hypothetical protein
MGYQPIGQISSKDFNKKEKEIVYQYREIDANGNNTKIETEGIRSERSNGKGK